jgi:nicotinamide-nucleotide amidase
MVSDAIRKAIHSSDFVIITGGLGSTDDDLTNEIVAKALDRPLNLDKQMYDQIESHAKARGLDMSLSMEKMAWMPKGSRMLNPKGTACGFCLVENEVCLYFLPGVPDQMRYLMDHVVLPELLRRYEPLPVMRQRILKLYGLSEPAIAERLKDLQNNEGEMVLGFYPHFPENHITFSLRGEDESSVVAKLDRFEEALKARLGAYVFADGNGSMEEAAGMALEEKALTLAVAESCTGGLIGHRLTNVPGSSVYYRGGVVVYSNQAKMDLLQVELQTLEKHGAVSDETAKEMANGVRQYMKTHLGLAVTGIAGPDGGSKDKPVGTVHMALAADKETVFRKYLFWGDREKIKANTAMMALDWIRRYLNGDPLLSRI